jgi:hypothetical protein
VADDAGDGEIMGMLEASLLTYWSLRALALVRLKLLPNLFLTPRKLCVAVFANCDWGTDLHESKFPLIYHCSEPFPEAAQVDYCFINVRLINSYPFVRRAQGLR